MSGFFYVLLNFLAIVVIYRYRNLNRKEDKMGVYDMRPEEEALRKKLKREEILGAIGAVMAWLLFMVMAYIACLVF
jgi:hypothetical protein